MGGLFGRPFFLFWVLWCVWFADGWGLGVLDVEDFACDGSGSLADLGVGGVAQVCVGFGSVSY